MIRLIFATLSVGILVNLVESKSLVDTVTHELYLKQAAETRANNRHIAID